MRPAVGSCFIYLMVISSTRAQSPYTLSDYASAINNADPLEDSKHTYRYSANGKNVEVPRGVFHYTENEQNIDGGFKVPDANGAGMDPMGMIAQLMQAASGADTRRKTMSGIYLPLPFGMKPINFQLSQSSGNGISFDEDAQPNTKQGLRRSPKKNKVSENLNMSPLARSQLLKARLACISDDVEDCDRKLDKYFRTRFGASPMEKSMKRAAATPNNVEEIADTELAAWLIPGLRERLEHLQSDDDVEESTESAEETEKGMDYGTHTNDIRRSAVRNPL